MRITKILLSISTCVVLSTPVYAASTNAASADTFDYSDTRMLHQMQTTIESIHCSELPSLMWHAYEDEDAYKRLQTVTNAIKYYRHNPHAQGNYKRAQALAGIFVETISSHVKEEDFPKAPKDIFVLYCSTQYILSEKPVKHRQGSLDSILQTPNQMTKVKELDCQCTNLLKSSFNSLKSFSSEQPESEKKELLC